jgi:hypothetical protein
MERKFHSYLHVFLFMWVKSLANHHEMPFFYPSSHWLRYDYSPTWKYLLSYCHRWFPSLTIIPVTSRHEVMINFIQIYAIYLSPWYSQEESHLFNFPHSREIQCPDHWVNISHVTLQGTTGVQYASPLTTSGATVSGDPIRVWRR